MIDTQIIGAHAFMGTDKPEHTRADAIMHGLSAPIRVIR